MNFHEQRLMSFVWAMLGLAILGISAPASAAAAINNLTVTGSTCGSSSGPYVVQQTGLIAGATQYIDRTFTISGSVPSVINGQTFIQTCNGDKNLSPGATSLVSFSVGQNSSVYILHDTQVTPEPTWLTANFTDLGVQITNDNSHIFELFVSNATYASGSTVTLGSNIQSGTNTSYAMYSIVVVPAGAAALISGLTVNNSTAAGGTGLAYAIQSNGFTAGAVQYVDRTYTLSAPVSNLVSGQTYIQTANGDKAASPGSSNFMSFTVGQAASVYVAIDQRVTTQPTWLTSTFTDTGTTIQAGGASPGLPFELFVKAYAAGSVVTLGSNIPAGGNNQNSMYSVIVVPGAGPAGNVFWVYHDGQFNWAGDYSFDAQISYTDTAGVPISGAFDISVLIQSPFGGFQPFTADGQFDTSPYKYLIYSMKPTMPNQIFATGFDANNDVPDGSPLVVAGGSAGTKYGPTPVVGQWASYKVPLADFGFNNPLVLKFTIADGTGDPTNLFYVDDVGFSAE